jgi:hypothetical protein
MPVPPRPAPRPPRVAALALLGVAALLAACDGTDSGIRLAAAGVVSARNVKITWEPLPDRQVAVERAAPGADFVEVARRSGERGRFLDLGLLPETRYRYRLRACGDGACGPAVELPAVETPRSNVPAFTVTASGAAGDAADEVVVFGTFAASFDPFSPGQGVAVDRDGNVLWELDSPTGIIFEVQPLADGTLALEQGGDLIWIDLDQSLKLRYTGRIVHHDIDQLADGRFLFLGYDIFDEPAGFTMLGDTIDILGADQAHIDWEWRGRDHIPTADVCSADLNVVLWGLGHDWTHANAVIFDEAAGRMYLNVRNLNRLYAIDYPSGEVAWIMGDGGDFGAGLWDHSHDPVFTAPNRFVVLDNGSNRPGPERYSRVIEVSFDETARTAAVVWEYRETPDFYSPFLGSVTPQKNGDVLVTDGTGGRLFQVSRDKTITWQLQIDLGYFTYKAVTVPRAFFTDW